MTFEGLARAGNADLEALLRSSAAPAPDSLAGHEWRGYNTPFFTRLLGIQKFIKGFFMDGGSLEGYNIPVSQNGLASPWLHRPGAGAPKRFGFYLVRRVEPGAPDGRYPRALLLDYGASPRNMVLRPERVLRDYLAQPDPANPDLLLGKAYLALGGPRIPSNFFILERLRRTDWKP
ncbi:MAG: hypothetical protein HY927_15330 [Elusimicrobia bacterium]|nr:hypothetical protein [Elusimicrobiota bacterium]